MPNQSVPNLEFNHRAVPILKHNRAVELGPSLPPPHPGRTTFGWWYEHAIVNTWDSGGAYSWKAICPSNLGGNHAGGSTSFLTGKPMTSRGQETGIIWSDHLVASLFVFDWRPADQGPGGYQVIIPFDSSGFAANYLRDETLPHGETGQTLWIYDVSSTPVISSGDTTWYNQSYLRNRTTDAWDLIFQSTYLANTLSDADPHGQRPGDLWFAIWEQDGAPDPILGTEPLGVMQAAYATRGTSGWISDMIAANDSVNMARYGPDFGSVMLHDEPRHWLARGG